MKLISRSTLKLTPILAKEFLSFEKFESQRAIRSSRVDALVKVIENGLFYNADIVLAKLGNNFYVLNGQHCCSAVVQSGKSVDVTLLEYECQDQVDMSQLFRQFDNGCNTRNVLEVLNVERDVIGKGNWFYAIAPLVVSAVIELEGNFVTRGGRFRYSRDDKAKILRHSTQEGDFVNDLIGGSSYHISDKFLRRVSVVSAIITTWRKRKHTAEIFWTEVRDGVNLKRNSPQLRLRDYLTQIKVTGQRMNREIYSKCIHAWNAYISNENTNLSYYSSAKLPKPK